MIDLYQYSIRIICGNQAPSGVYIASPAFPVYRYCWFRDGAFIAYSMDLAGCHKSARQFHEWASRTILNHKEKARRGIMKASQGRKLQEGDYLHARYTIEGEEAKEEWTNFQLDGLGSWLWSLAQHIDLTGEMSHQWEGAVQLIADYLAALWRQPCYDCWEEYGDRIHISTLAAIYGGLRSVAKVGLIKEMITICEEIRQFIPKNGVKDGHLIRYVGNPDIDSSLLSISTPYRLLRPDDKLMRATVAKIKKDLQGKGGGLHRYLKDTYYGGGQWILLTAWLGWYYAELGDFKGAKHLLTWVESQVDREGNFPEQVPQDLLTPDITKSGLIAGVLLPVLSFGLMLCTLFSLPLSIRVHKLMGIRG